MTRKDYVIIAKALERADQPEYRKHDTFQESIAFSAGVELAAACIATELQMANPDRFDRDKFEAAVKGN